MWGAGRERGGVDVYETLCPQQMLVLKGGKNKNWGGVRTEMSHLQNYSVKRFKEHCRYVKKMCVCVWGGGLVRGWGGGQGGCD